MRPATCFGERLASFHLQLPGMSCIVCPRSPFRFYYSACVRPAVTRVKLQLTGWVAALWSEQLTWKSSIWVSQQQQQQGWGFMLLSRWEKGEFSIKTRASLTVYSRGRKGFEGHRVFTGLEILFVVLRLCEWISSLGGFCVFLHLLPCFLHFEYILEHGISEVVLIWGMLN